MADKDTADTNTDDTAQDGAAKTTAKAAGSKPAAAKATAKEATAKADAPKAAEKPAAEKPAAAKAPAKAKDAPASSAGTSSPAKASAAKAGKAGAAKAQAPLGAGGTLKVHHLRPAPGARTAKTRVGRGEGSKGKTAGRGTKGTKARYQVSPAFEGGQMPLHMRLPKLRGFTNPFRTTYQVVNLDRLAELYPSGGTVTVDDLVAKGAVRKGLPVKVLGSGAVTVKLDVAVDACSASAKEKILAAGGSISQD